MSQRIKAARFFGGLVDPAARHFRIAKIDRLACNHFASCLGDHCLCFPIAVLINVAAENPCSLLSKSQGRQAPLTAASASDEYRLVVEKTHYVLHAVALLRSGGT